MTNIADDTANAAPIVSIQIWVAGTDSDQARNRRQAAQEWMNHLLVTYVGSGSGRFFYDLWCERTGTDPLASEGDCIADVEYHLATHAVSPADLAALTHNIAEDLEEALGFPVAVELEVASDDEEIDAQSACRSDGDGHAGAIMAVIISEWEHATILAALRHVARRGGFEDTAEVRIATNLGQWEAMSPDEIDELGDRFNTGSDPMHIAHPRSGGAG